MEEVKQIDDWRDEHLDKGKVMVPAKRRCGSARV